MWGGVGGSHSVNIHGPADCVQRKRRGVCDERQWVVSSSWRWTSGLRRGAASRAVAVIGVARPAREGAAGERRRRVLSGGGVCRERAPAR